LSVYISVSKGFSPPSIDEVRGGNNEFNNVLRAEEAINYEAGIKGSLLNKRLWFELSIYQFNLRNTIVSRRDSSGGDFFTNAGKTRQYGIESSIEYYPVNNMSNFMRQVKFWGNYTYINARFINFEQSGMKFDGNKLTGTTPNIVNAGIDVNTAPGIFGNVTYNYTDHIPLNDANTFYGTRYHLIFTKAGYRFKIG
jgi:iron complex outermembrane receptor protein